MQLRFEWDEGKNRSNQRKHGISFERAVNVLRDPWVVSIPDRYIDGEQRWKSIGKVGEFTLLLVVHTVWEDDNIEVVRVISARYATAARKSFMEKKMVKYTWETLPALTDADLEDLKGRAPKCDSEIDTSDIPEVTPAQWRRAVRGRFHRPQNKR